LDKDSRILIACEESGVVTGEFIKLGYKNVWSCDLEPTSGNYPDHHIQQDVIPLLKEKWDMIIAFPPCTYLTVAGNRWFKPEYEDRFPTRLEDRAKAIDFFMLFANADCPLIAIENPIGIMSRLHRKPDQIIQPWQFGHPFTKNTCLWLKGLPTLTPTNVLQRPEFGWENQQFTKDGRYGGYGGKFGCNKNGKWLRYGDPEVKKARSKTFPGIARAMAEQWAGQIK
jgi:hypothetical protein